MKPEDSAAAGFILPRTTIGDIFLEYDLPTGNTYFLSLTPFSVKSIACEFKTPTKHPYCHLNNGDATRHTFDMLEN